MYKEFKKNEKIEENGKASKANLTNEIIYMKDLSTVNKEKISVFKVAIWSYRNKIKYDKIASYNLFNNYIKN